MAPEDSTWSLDDARHSSVGYKASQIANASGPHVADPRSGEILESHDNLYHNVMEQLHQWYFIQAAAVDPKARRMQFDDKLMGKLIRFVSSHEVGHTLGLRHNFGSSSTVPVEKLRDKQWVESHGHTPSIMDYARFNYVAQPEDSIGEAGLFPRIGDYDKWAIEWGYRWWPEFGTREQEDSYSNQMITSRLTTDKRLSFLSEEGERNPTDPRSQTEDLGDNAMLASAYGLKNLKRILPNLLAWAHKPNDFQQSPGNMYRKLLAQYGRYMGHVCNNLGGIYKTPRPSSGEQMYRPVPKEIQQQALAFLQQELFVTPTWLINKELIEQTGYLPYASIISTQKAILETLLDKRLINRMSAIKTRYGNQGYDPQDMLNELKKGIWSELQTGKMTDTYRRNLQNAYIVALIKLCSEAAPPSLSKYLSAPDPNNELGETDVRNITKALLKSLLKDLKKTLLTAKGMDKIHFQGISDNITMALETKSKKD